MGELAKFLQWVISDEAPEWVSLIAGGIASALVVSAFMGAFLLFVILAATGHYALMALMFPGAPVAICYVAYRRATK